MAAAQGMQEQKTATMQEQDAQQDAGPIHYLVAVDGSASSWAGWDSAMYLMDDSRDKITAVTVTNEKRRKMYSDISHKFNEEKIQEELKDAGKALPEAQLAVKLIYDEKSLLTKNVVIATAEAEQCDVLVTGVRGRKHGKQDPDAPANYKHSILGSTTDFSLRQWKGTSIIAERDFAKPEPGKAVFVVGVDGSENSLKGYQTARRFMKKGDVVKVVHVKAITTDESKRPERFRSSVIAKHYTDLLKDDPQGEFVMLESGGEVAAVINEYIEKQKAHFLCVGADGMKAFVDEKPFFGSVSDKLVKLTSSCTCIVSQINSVE